MNQRMHVFLVMLVVCGQTEYFFDTRKCVHACTFAIFKSKHLLCSKCADDPPLSREMCEYACGTMKLNIYNMEYVDRICNTCFEKRVNLMDFHICGKCYLPDVPKDSRLCGECYIKGLPN